MKLKILKGLIVVWATVVFAPLASAGLVTYDFTDVDHWKGKSLGTSEVFTEQGLNLTVSAMEKNGSNWSNGGRVVWEDGNKRGAKGLGVKLLGTNDNWEIDGSGPDEGLKFTFDWEVELALVKTWFGDWNDDWNLSVKDGNGWDHILDDSYKSEYKDGIYTKEFMVWADHQSDSLTVKKIMVNHRKMSVPEPGTVALLGLGLVGLVLTRRTVK